MNPTSSPINYGYYKSPLGIIYAAATDQGICTLNFQDDQSVVSDENLFAPTHPILLQLINELNQYFSGKLKSFTVPCDPQGTAFQNKVWQLVSEIPYGDVISYSGLSDQLNQRDAIRAVANANARNPVLILIPCHRVIGTDGNLTGYAAGIHRKKMLLELEGALQPSHQLNLEF